VIPVFGSEVGEAELAEVAGCMRSQWLGQGPLTERFEQGFRERLGLGHFLLVDSGSNALYLAMHLLDLPPGSEVILPSFTWVSCAHAVLLAGCRPVFCDVDPQTQNLTVETVRARMSPRTAAIMVVHYAGKPVDMDPILALGLPVIEDAAHAVDSRYHGRPCGSMGDVGVYSFDAIKNLTTGGGGGITVRDERRFERARKLRYCGIGQSGFQVAGNGDKSPARWWEYDISEVFIKMTPSDVAAGIGLAQLRRLDALQQRRQQIWTRYGEELGSLPQITTPAEPAEDERHSMFTYFIRVPERDRVARALLARGIYTTLRFHPLHLNPIFASTGRLPISEALNREGLNIPLHPRLSDDEVAQVIEALAEVTA